VRRAAVVVVIALLVAAAGGAVGYFLGSEDEEAVTVTTTTTVTETVTDTVSGLPAAVEATRKALFAAAEVGDYEALRPLIPASGFEYTFGGPVEGGPIAYWQELERTTDERPLETLAALLEMPYVLSRGYYVWPWAYTVTSVSDLSEHEKALLAPLGELSTLFVPDTGYVGWRTGIAANGTWTFFVAGD
jgi:hypothetical protein